MSINMYALEEEVFAKPYDNKSEDILEYDDLVDFAQESIVDGLKSSTEAFAIMALYETRGLEDESVESVEDKRGVFKKIWDFIKEVAKKIVENVKKFFTFIVSSFKKLISGFTVAKELDKEAAVEFVNEAKKENPKKKLVDPTKIKEAIKDLGEKIKTSATFKTNAKKVLTGIKVAATSAIIITGLTALNEQFAPGKKSSEEYFSHKDYNSIFENVNASEMVSAAEKLDKKTVDYFGTILNSLDMVSHNVDIFDDVNRSLDGIDRSITDKSSRKDISDATKAVQQVTKIGHDYTSDIFASASAISSTMTIFDRLIKKNAKAVARKNSVHSKTFA